GGTGELASDGSCPSTPRRVMHPGPSTYRLLAGRGNAPPAGRKRPIPEGPFRKRGRHFGGKLPPVTQLPSVERIRRAWQVRARGAREQALVAVLLVVVVGGAHVARLGTPWARIAAASAILAIVAWQIGLAVARRRENASTRLTVKRVFSSTDPALGDRALR